MEFHGNNHLDSFFEIHNKTIIETRYFIETVSNGSTKTDFTDEMRERLKQVKNNIGSNEDLFWCRSNTCAIIRCYCEIAST